MNISTAFSQLIIPRILSHRPQQEPFDLTRNRDNVMGLVALLISFFFQFLFYFYFILFYYLLFCAILVLFPLLLLCVSSALACGKARKSLWRRKHVAHEKHAHRPAKGKTKWARKKNHILIEWGGETVIGAGNKR